MGVASSKNVSEAIVSVTNYVNNSTSANSAQTSSVKQRVGFKDCTLILDGDFNVESSAELFQTNNQIVSAINDTNLNNNIQQKMMQEAASTVGSMGIGYANASNSASMFSNVGNTIKNSMNAAANQYSDVDQKFDCNGSYIKAKNLNINFGSSSNFLSDQTLNQQSTTDIVNSITQTSTQKATAKVEGLAMFLIAIALIIVALGYTVFKPLTTGPFKMLFAVIIIVLIAIVFMFMFIRKTPPLFDDNNICSMYSDLGRGSDNNECVKPTEKIIQIKKAPLRYLYGILPRHSGPDGGGNLVQMAIAAVLNTNTPGDNGGYRIDTMEKLEKIIRSFDIYNNDVQVGEGLPNPLYNPSSNKFYKVPIEYKNNGGGDGQNAMSKCSPGILQINKNTNSDTKITDCPQTVSIKTLQNSGLEVDNKTDSCIANFNETGWEDYLNVKDETLWRGNNIDTEKRNRAMWARFVLCDMISKEVDLTIYIDDLEFVRVTGEANKPVYKNGSNCGECYKYKPVQTVDFLGGLKSSGSITGQFGFVNDTTYQLHEFSSKIGIWILLGILSLTFMYMGYTHYSNKKAGKIPGSKGKPTKVKTSI
jgi:hypothetical protein